MWTASAEPTVTRQYCSLLEMIYDVQLGFCMHILMTPVFSFMDELPVCVCTPVFLKKLFTRNYRIKIMLRFGPITSWEIDGETVETVSDFYFFWAPKSLQMVTAAMKLKDAYSLEGKL